MKEEQSIFCENQSFIINHNMNKIIMDEIIIDIQYQIIQCMLHSEDILLEGKYEDDVKNRLEGCRKGFEKKKFRITY